MSVADQAMFSESRTILGPAGNRVDVSEHEIKKVVTTEKTKKLIVKKVEKPVRAVVDRSKISGDVVLSCVNKNGKKDDKGDRQSGRKAVPRAVKQLSSRVSVPLKRCDWITPFSDPLYVAFHDGEWGVPVRDDQRLFELFVLSIALAELTWPEILCKRELFRKHFDDFDPTSVAKFSEETLLSVKANCSTLLSEQKLRAVVENANQLLKVQEEHGSFSNYFWRFVNNKPIRNGIRYARQVPVKTPKSEVISKDLMQRGFRCVGPTVVHSFMQVAGMTNDHLITCFRYHECNSKVELNLKSKKVANKVSAD